MPPKDPARAKAIKRAYYERNRALVLARSKAQRETDQYRAAQPERSRRSMLRKRYGLSLEYYRNMAAYQDERCAICGQTAEQANKQVKHLAVDHCHKTGIVRALLCHACNVLVAYAEHPRLPDALAYLAKYPTTDEH